MGLISALIKAGLVAGASITAYQASAFKVIFSLLFMSEKDQ